MSELLDSLWIEKYRPDKLEDVSLPEHYKKDFEKSIERQDIPNLLFSGPPGGGKTTLALILTSKNGILQNKSDNLLMANGSSKKARSINFVDQVIEPFLKTPPSGDKYKIVFMDEADNLTGDSYDSWRGIIEKYHKAYGRFIWTCNYVSKIPDPVQSRFTPYVFQQIPKDFVYDYCKKILETENIKYQDKDINFVISQLYPDIRRIVNILQRSSGDEKLEINQKDVITKEKILIANIVEIVSLISKNQDKKVGTVVNKIMEIVSKEDLEYRNIYTELFFMGTIPAQAKIIVNKYSNSHQGCLIQHMHFMSMVFEIIKSLQDYKRAMIGK